MSLLSRRAFVQMIAASAPLACVRPLQANTLPDARALEFLHTHTGERLAVEYVAGGNYIPGALDTLNHFLRDFRTGDVHAIDPKLFDLLHSLKATTGGRRPFGLQAGGVGYYPASNFIHVDTGRVRFW